MKVIFIKALRKIILTIFSIMFVAGAIFTVSAIQPKQVSAQTCDYIGQCINNKVCECVMPGSYACYIPGSGLVVVGDSDCGSAIIGGVEPPPAVGVVNSASGSDIGIVFFISRLIRFANIVAGILVMINFVIAGFTYVANAGSTSVNEKVKDQMTWSVLGILLIVGSYALAGIFGLVFYGDPTFIISPTLETALNQP